MIAAEAFTYAISGCVVGTLIGLFLSKMMYQTLISSHFASATWTIPIAPLIFILTVLLLSAALATYAPVKRLQKISIVETINEL